MFLSLLWVVAWDSKISPSVVWVPSIRFDRTASRSVSGARSTSELGIPAICPHSEKGSVCRTNEWQQAEPIKVLGRELALVVMNGTHLRRSIWFPPSFHGHGYHGVDGVTGVRFRHESRCVLQNQIFDTQTSLLCIGETQKPTPRQLKNDGCAIAHQSCIFETAPLQITAAACCAARIWIPCQIRHPM